MGLILDSSVMGILATVDSKIDYLYDRDKLGNFIPDQIDPVKTKGSNVPYYPVLAIGLLSMALDRAQFKICPTPLLKSLQDEMGFKSMSVYDLVESGEEILQILPATTASFVVDEIEGVVFSIMHYLDSARYYRIVTEGNCLKLKYTTLRRQHEGAFR